MGLTNKQSVFIDEYLVDLNATQAALRAGYSKKTAYSQGARLLKDVEIQRIVNDRLSKRAMPAEEVLQLLTEHARGDMGEFLDIESMSFRVSLQKAKDLGITHLIKKVKERTVMTSNGNGEETETHTFELELYDAKSALDTLAKYHGLLVDRTDITSGGGPIVLRVIYANDKDV